MTQVDALIQKNFEILAVYEMETPNSFEAGFDRLRNEAGIPKSSAAEDSLTEKAIAEKITGLRASIRETYGNNPELYEQLKTKLGVNTQIEGVNFIALDVDAVQATR